MTPDKFIEDWKASKLNEKEGAHLHFDGLCKLLGVAPPSANSKDVGYSFEQFVEKVGGGGGYADVRKRGCFAWEYKSPGGDLKAALKQLKLYASDLENPPLLIVSDMRRIEIHTNWTNMVQESHVLEIDDLADVRLRQKLKWAFEEATIEQLKPHRAADATTKEVAEKFASIAQNLRARGHDPEKVAHFVNRMVFCMFAEDVDLLPKKMFERMLSESLKDPDEFVANAETLFTAMAKKHGRVGYDAIDWFNGGLFEDGSALPLTRAAGRPIDSPPSLAARLHLKLARSWAEQLGCSLGPVFHGHRCYSQDFRLAASKFDSTTCGFSRQHVGTHKKCKPLTVFGQQCFLRLVSVRASHLQRISQTFLCLIILIIACASLGSSAVAREAERFICPYLPPAAPRSEKTVSVGIEIENQMVGRGKLAAELGNNKNLQYSVAADLACYLDATTTIVDGVDADIRVRIVGKSESDKHRAVDLSEKMEVALISSRISFNREKDALYVTDWLEQGCFASRFAHLYWLPKVWGDPRAAATKLAAKNPSLLAYSERIGVSCTDPSVPTLFLQNYRKEGGREYTLFSNCEAFASGPLGRYLKAFNLAMLELKSPVFKSCRPE